MASDSKKRPRVISDSRIDLEACESVKKRGKTLAGWLGTAKPRVSVAIIGTAGRGGKGARMSKSLYMAMVQAATDVIENTWKLSWSQIDLVSGGAAWAGRRNQTQALPTVFYGFFCTPKFLDNGVRDWQKNPGSSAYHRSFSSALGYNSLSDIQQVAQLGAVLNSDHFGFHERNKQVAKVDNMLALTWNDSEPEDGGTKHTWSLCTGRKVHIGLASLVEESSASETYQTTSISSSSDTACSSQATHSQTSFPVPAPEFDSFNECR